MNTDEIMERIRKECDRLCPDDEKLQIAFMAGVDVALREMNAAIKEVVGKPRPTLKDSRLI